MDLVMPELFGISGYRDPGYAASGASGSAEMKAGLAAALAADAKATAFYNENVQTKRVDLTLPGLEALGTISRAFPAARTSSGSATGCRYTSWLAGAQVARL